jgi:hypothetical protein
VERRTGEAVRRATRGNEIFIVFRPEGAKEFDMPGTYSQLLLHIVFSTKHRQR